MIKDFLDPSKDLTAVFTDATILSDYGKALSKIDNAFMLRANESEKTKAIIEINNQQHLVANHFNKKHKTSPIKKYLCLPGQSNTDIRITAIASLLLWNYISDNEPTHLGSVCHSISTPLNANPLEIRRLITALIVKSDDLVRSVDDRYSGQLRVGLGSKFITACLGSDAFVKIPELISIRKSKGNDKQNQSPVITSPQTLFQELKRYVIGQDNACKVLATRGYLHLKRAELLKTGKNLGKNECLMFISASSGCGKTLLADKFSQAVNIPFCNFDSTAATQTGVVGLEIVEDSIKSLIKSAGNPRDPKTFEKARYGCLFFDEFTKKATRITDGRDYAGQGCQQEVLKAMEASCPIILGHKRMDFDYSETEFSTNGTLFIFGGFIDHYDKVLKKMTTASSPIGFDSAVGLKKGAYMYDLLVAYGYIPEFVNRLTAIVPFRKLEVDDFVQIAKSEHGAIFEYNKLLKHQGLSIAFSEDAIQEMAQICFETGQARTVHFLVSALVQEAVFNCHKGHIEFGVNDVRKVEGRLDGEVMEG